MPDPQLFLLFIGACVVLALIPGPNVALIVANSIAHGVRYGLVSVAGTSSAMVPQLTITVLGASTLVALVASAFEWLRWLGVAYLLWLGLRSWFAAGDDGLEIGADRRAQAARAIYWRGFVVSATNPKTLFFFAAFLPQFVSPQGDVTAQMIVLSVAFIAVLTLVDCGWALLAGTVRPLLMRVAGLRHKISGGFFLAAALGLALARRP